MHMKLNLYTVFHTEGGGALGYPPPSQTSDRPPQTHFFTQTF